MNKIDLEAIQQVYDLVKRASIAQKRLASYSQQQVDAIVAAMAKAGGESSEYLARLAVEETGMGRVTSKIAKNHFAVTEIYESIRHLKTTGIINFDASQQCYEIAEPVGVIAAIIPTTNPTSTALFKALIAIKARNSVVFAPHPRAVRCTSETVAVINAAAIQAGAPDGCLECISKVSLQATQQLMHHDDVDLILATGGPGLVKASYQSGKPALGVGSGNTPAYIDRSAHVAHAVRCIVESQMFDYGTVCSSEQSVIVDEPIKQQVISEFQNQGGYFLSPQQVEAVSGVVMHDNRMNPEIVGKSAVRIAGMAGLNVPENTTVLLAPLSAVGADYPLSREKLAPILAFYQAKGWEAACKLCFSLITLEGKGHTLAVHATNPDIIMEFGLQKPVARIIVNAPSAHGGIGLATNLLPSMTLGCGTEGGNITSDNISSHHLINIKRVAAIRSDFPLWPGQRSIPEELTKLELTEQIPATAPAIDSGTRYSKACFSMSDDGGSQDKSCIDPWEERSYPLPPSINDWRQQKDWPSMPPELKT